MKRKAILIPATYPENPLPGVETDIKNWHSFLTSNYGGAWDVEEEILQIPTPTRDSVLKCVEGARECDYALICFSGHGFVLKDEMGIPETFLLLNAKEKISERELNPGCPRCMITMDCCRNIKYSPEVDIFLESSEGLGKVASANEAYRVFYEQELLKCEKGYTRIYSADLDESAEDETSFTSVLLSCAADWASRSTGVFRISDAMESAIGIIAHIHSQQHPKYLGGRRLHHFPLAVNPAGLYT